MNEREFQLRFQGLSSWGEEDESGKLRDPRNDVAGTSVKQRNIRTPAKEKVVPQIRLVIERVHKHAQ